jgi:hypothetical protein
VLVPVDQLAYNARLSGRGIDRIEVADLAVVVDACQAKRPCGVIEVEPDGTVCVETEWSDRCHVSGVLVDCEESVARDIDSEHATDWMHRDTDNRHALWNAEKATDYRRHEFAAPIDAGQEEVSVGKNREVVRTRRLKNADWDVDFFLISR